MAERGDTGAEQLKNGAARQPSRVGDASSERIGRRTMLGAGVAAAALGSMGLGGMGVGVAQDPAAAAKSAAADPKQLRISLAQWSLHKSLFAGAVKPLDFPAVAARDYGIRGVEYVNSFYKDLIGKEGFAEDLRRRCSDAGVTSVLIMCDGEGALGDPSDAKRAKAIDNHRKWLELAKHLGCHAIRVNAQSDGERAEQARLSADGLRRLSEAAKPLGLNVIVENHGGLSSHGDWLAGVMKAVGMDNCGTLPDFGNFYEYDRYRGVEDLMPFAKAVSAKSYDFDAQGNETKIDYPRMLGLVRAAGYSGWIGIEYEGGRLSEPDGIKATRELLARLGCGA
jgi:sugar phosphate isomerase/epimerase